MRAETAPPKTLPDIDDRSDFQSLVTKLCLFFDQAVVVPHEDWDELRKEVYVENLRPLVKYLVDNVQHPAIISALLAAKWHFDSIDDEDDKTLNDTRGLACELVAWRFLVHLTYRESIEFLCYDLPAGTRGSISSQVHQQPGVRDIDDTLEGAANESAPLMGSPEESRLGDSFYEDGPLISMPADGPNFAYIFAGLSALEIAAVSDAKKFMAQKAVQRIVEGIWKGDIVLWETLSTHSTKHAQVYRKHLADPYCRLRVPLYLKVFEVLFFALFLIFYYHVLVRKNSTRVTGSEVFLYIWLVSFAYNELGEFLDAGVRFYATDFWSLWDLGIIATGIAFFITRMVGLARHDGQVTDTAFDILSVEALFLVPRICSLLSLHPYFGMLIPALKEMTKDFVKFLGLVAILYAGFTTTFAFLARGTYSFGQMNWILIKVFFGSSYLGFDVAEKISPVLGPPLMFIFVCMTNILLITSLISLLSNTLTRIQLHARDEYLFVFAIYVLEASSSNRLTYFLPPLNLLPLLLLRPLRILLPARIVRQARIVLLKATHWPFVALILGYESGRLYWAKRHRSGPSAVSPVLSQHAPASLRRPLARKTLVGARRSPLDEEPRGARSAVEMRVDGPRAGPEPNENLAGVVASLRTQLEALSSLIDRQQDGLRGRAQEEA